MRQMMQQMGGPKRGRKAKKGRKGKVKGRSGGRVTAKGPTPIDKAAFSLPSLEEMEAQLPGRGRSLDDLG
jgi:hypothetical protein